jgi:hypothetical protein
MRANGVPVSTTRIEDDEPLDSEVAQALESYLAAVESGQPVDLERLAAEHPGIAEQLRFWLGVLKLSGHVEGDAEAGLRVARRIGVLRTCWKHQHATPDQPGQHS